MGSIVTINDNWCCARGRQYAINWRWNFNHSNNPLSLKGGKTSVHLSVVFLLSPKKKGKKQNKTAKTKKKNILRLCWLATTAAGKKRAVFTDIVRRPSYVASSARFIVFIDISETRSATDVRRIFMPYPPVPMTQKDIFYIRTSFPAKKKKK